MSYGIYGARAVFVLLALCVPGASAQKPSEAEQADLREAVGEAGNSTIDLVRAIEVHLAKYPNSARKLELERALVKGAIELKDDQRTALYGERVLQSAPDDLQILDNVARALLATGDRAAAERALGYARHFQELVESMAKTNPAGGEATAQRKNEIDHGIGRALLLESEASAKLGRDGDAVRLAESAFQIFPSEEFARQAAETLAAAGKTDDAIHRYADAFTIPDARAKDADRARDRLKMGELYRGEHGSEKGLGDEALAAYDRTCALLAQRRAAASASDPNAALSDAMQFTLTGPNGRKLNLRSMRGKVLVLDFWATWCGPCRAQHPLYEKVKQEFKDRGDVAFLAIATDEDRALVEPFLDANHWSGANVYFESGLSGALRVSNIPATLIYDKRGKIVSRMDGYLPDRFVEMLGQRIRAALDDAPPAAK
ncbi:MAG: TlpA disulfide reductase family protein [Bryobacteraceae bacterium]